MKKNIVLGLLLLVAALSSLKAMEKPVVLKPRVTPKSAAYLALINIGRLQQEKISGKPVSYDKYSPEELKDMLKEVNRLLSLDIKSLGLTPEQIQSIDPAGDIALKSIKEDLERILGIKVSHKPLIMEKPIMLKPRATPISAAQQEVQRNLDALLQEKLAGKPASYNKYSLNALKAILNEANRLLNFENPGLLIATAQRLGIEPDRAVLHLESVKEGLERSVREK
jgi:hypothetical protein